MVGGGDAVVGAGVVRVDGVAVDGGVEGAAGRVRAGVVTDADAVVGGGAATRGLVPHPPITTVAATTSEATTGRRGRGIVGVSTAAYTSASAGSMAAP